MFSPLVLPLLYDNSTALGLSATAAAAELRADRWLDNITVVNY